MQTIIIMALILLSLLCGAGMVISNIKRGIKQNGYYMGITGLTLRDIPSFQQPISETRAFQLLARIKEIYPASAKDINIDTVIKDWTENKYVIKLSQEVKP